MNPLLIVPPLLAALAFGSVAKAQPTAYREEVVAKADQVLANAGLRRAGKSITVVELGPLQRAIRDLAKPRRMIRGLAETIRQTEGQLTMIDAESRLAQSQHGELNLALAQPGLDVLTNNRLVGLINANRAHAAQLAERQVLLKQTLAKQRKELSDAEAGYAEVVLAARQDLDRIREQLRRSLADPQLPIALTVLAATFQTPDRTDVDSLVGPISRRLEPIEREIFRETIPLRLSPRGNLQVDVVVNDQNLAMILDGNAALVVLPAETAQSLGIRVAADATPIRMVLANGDVLPAREAILPSLRVGGFVAKNIAAAVLEDAGSNVQPLLGMSFLEHFNFELDAPAKQLKLLRLNAE